jgi:hypothetical protein
MMARTGQDSNEREAEDVDVGALQGMWSFTKNSHSKTAMRI